MIQIVYNKPYNRLTSIGHASGPSGNNVPCGCVSALAYTLSANVQRLEAEGAARIDSNALLNGNAEISCTPIGHGGPLIKNTFETVCVGFEILAEVFPEDISYEVRGE